MLRTLIRQELLTHLMSARFFSAVVIILLLVIANTFVLMSAYEKRLANYSQQEAMSREKVTVSPTYSLLDLSVHRPPNPLSLFSTGLDTQLGGAIDISHVHVPTLLTSKWRHLDNPYLSLFSHIDIVFVFQVVLSLLGLLFAYDAIAGESEAGTLRLVMSHPVRHGSILFAKYVAAMICLILPVLMSLLMVLILLSLANSIQLALDDFLRIGGIVLTTTAYLSFFYLLGLLISTTTRRAATSLMLCMFLWVILVLVYPNWSRFDINPVGNMSAEKSSAMEQAKQIWEEIEREKRRFLANSPLTGQPPMFNMSFSMMYRKFGGERYQIDCKPTEASQHLIPHVQNFHEFISQVEIHLAEKTGLVHKQMLEQTDIRQARWTERLMKLSPASLYTFATAAWAGTDLDSMLDYIRATQRYRQTLIDYFHDAEAFGSRLWFASDQGSVDWSGLPRFTFERAEAWVNATRALPELFLLLLMNLVVFMSTFLVFIRIDV